MAPTANGVIKTTEALIVPPDIVILVPSGFKHPFCDAVAVAQAIAPLELVIVLPSVDTNPRELVVAAPGAITACPFAKIYSLTSQLPLPRY